MYTFNVILLFLTAVTLLLLPLEVPLRALGSPGSLTYDASELLLVLVLGIYLVSEFFSGRLVQPQRRFPLLLAGMSSVFILIGAALPGLFGQWPQSNPVEVLRLLSLVWLLPLGWHLRLAHPRMLLIVLFAGIAIIHAQWGLMHFAIQHDMGLQLLGERMVSPTVDGVAKFLNGETKVIRPYGPYGHPNPLAGSLLLVLVTLLFPRVLTSSSLKNEAKHVPTPQFHPTLFVVILLLSLTVFLSFSRAAYVSYIILLAILAWKTKVYKQPLPLAVPLMLIVVLLLPLLSNRMTDPEDAAADARLQGVIWGIDRYVALVGTGLGAYPVWLEHQLNISGVPHHAWEIEPIHSVPLLLLAEWGLGMAILLVLFSFSWLWHMNMQQCITMGLFIVAVAPLLLFDHYLLTETAPLAWLLLSAILVFPRSAPTPARA